MRHLSRPLALVLAAGALACGPASTSNGDQTGGGGTSPPAFALVGSWDDNYGGTHEITQTKWDADTIVSFDDDARWAVLQSPPDDQFTPNRFAKVVWTKPSDGSFWYCTVDFGLGTADAAKKTTKTADATDPSTGGCGGYPWTKMSPHFVLEGQWDDNYGTSTDIGADKWGTDTIVSHDDAAQYAILQSPPADPYTPNEFSKVVWTKPSNGTFWYCTVDFGKASVDEAKSTTKTADATHPDQGGCGGFPWTKMMPRFTLDGTWDDNYGGTTTITSVAWGTDTVVSYDDEARVAILQSPANDQYTPDKFSKNVWTKPAEDGSFWYCTVDFGLDSADAAKATTKTADDSDPASGGCGGFPWTHMTKHAG